MSWQNSVCMSIGKATIPDMNKLVIEEELASVSAIDNFYNSTREILTLSPKFFKDHSSDLVGLLFVGLISATENYFRDILGFILSECSSSQAHSADEKVQLGSLLWSPKSLHNRTAFEFLAFSNGKNIKETLRNFINYTIAQNGTTTSMLQEYDKLCELRHAIVHSGNIVAGKNAVKLQLKKTDKVLRVKVDYSTLQDAGKVCTALVQSANNELFEEMIDRWATSWRNTTSWNTSDEFQQLCRVRNAFISKRDSRNNTIPNKKQPKTLFKAISNAYGL